MITKEAFIEAISKEKELDNLICKYSNVINIDNDIFSCHDSIFYVALNSWFTEDGVEWVSYYLWEMPSDNEAPVRDADGNAVPLDTPEDLWELVKGYIKK